MAAGMENESHLWESTEEEKTNFDNGMCRKMNQVSRFQTLEKEKLVVPLTDSGTIEEGADLGQQMDLVWYI